MAQLYTFSIVLLLSISFSVGGEIEKQIERKIELDLSDFIDRVNPLIAIAIKESNLDPLKLPNITKNIALSTINITNGHLHDLSKIHRNKPAILSYLNKKISFHTGLEIKNVTMYADYALKRIWTTRKGQVTAYASPLRVEIGMSFNLKTRNFTLDTFNVNEIKDIQVQFTGNDKSDWIVNAISNAIASLLNNYIKKTVSQEVTAAIKGFLDKLGPHQSVYKPLLNMM